MSPRYRLTWGRAVAAAPGLGVFVLGERARFLATDPLLTRLLPALDRARDAADLADATGLPPAQVLYGIRVLERAGLVAPVAPPAGAPRAAVPEPAPPPPAAAADATAAARAGLRVVPVGDPLAPGALARMADAEASGLAWMPVKLTGERALAGPLFGPGAPACPGCLAAALRANRPVEAYLHATQARPFGLGADAAPDAPDAPDAPRAPGASAAEAWLAARLAAPDPRAALRADIGDAVLEWLPGADGPRRHTLGRRHDCARCGTRARPGAAHAPPRLDPDQPARRHAGGYRVAPAGAVLSRLRPLVSDLVGHVSSLGPLDTGPGRHVWAASYPVTPRDARPAADAFHGTALGKGRDAAQAEASALCEAIERLSAQWRGDAVERVAALSELGADAIAPNAIQLFSAAQIEARAAWNARLSDPRRHVPAPLDPDAPVPWVRAWSLTAGQWRWLPRDHAFANAPEPRQGRFDPNGCAAGATREEAALQGLLELVERDAVAIWWYTRARRPGLDAAEAGDAGMRALVQGIVRQGWVCHVLDLTTDIGVPVVAALARAHADGRWCVGFGAHLEADLAVERAITELAQLFRQDGRDGPPPWAPIDDGDEAFLWPAAPARLRDAAILGPPSGPATLAGLVDGLVRRLEGLGLETLLLDQTHPDIGFPVVKMTVPGLRHFWPRFGPGRLYDVPRALGWRAAPVDESALNPSHLFL